MKGPRNGYVRGLSGALIFGLALFVGERTNSWLASAIGAAALLSLAPRERSERQRAKVAKDLGLGVGTGVLLAMATWLTFPWIRSSAPRLSDELSRMLALLDHFPGRYFALPILALVVVAEERFFRGGLIQRYRHSLGEAKAGAVSVTLYVLPQLWTETLIMPLVAAGLGSLWTLQRLASSDVVMPLSCHLTWNLLVLVITPVG